MKKTFTILLLTGLLCTLVWQINSVEPAQAAVINSEYMQEIPLNATHFPDETFRQYVSHALDINKDGVLSREEREDIYYMDFSVEGPNKSSYWYEEDMNDGSLYSFAPEIERKDDYKISSKDKKTFISNFSSDNAIMDVKGVEYFFNLEEVRIAKYETIRGSFKNNVNLKKIWIRSSKAGEVSYDKVNSEFPLSQLTYFHLDNIGIKGDEIKPEKMPRLEVMRIVLPDGTNQKLKKLNLSKNKKLKDLELGNIVPPTLNLKNNTKLKSVKVYTGKSIRKEKARYTYYQLKKNMSCKIQFPKKNNISTLYYLVDNTSLDIRNLTNLENIQTLKKVKMKAKSSWIRKTFNKNNWGCIVSKDGVYQKKIKASKKKTTII